MGYWIATTFIYCLSLGHHAQIKDIETIECIQHQFTKSSRLQRLLIPGKTVLSKSTKLTTQMLIVRFNILPRNCIWYYRCANGRIIHIQHLEAHQIYIRCSLIIAALNAHILIVIFQFVFIR